LIAQFYAGRTILLTGGTGFVGQGLVAKILRDLPQVRRLYLLLRPRRLPDGAMIAAAQRLDDDLFAADVMARFRREDPQGFAAARARTRALDFDMSAPDLGLDPQARAEIIDEVDCIIGAAATVVFDEPLDRAVQVNTLGPLRLLELAKQCRKPVVYVHVSTAYVSGTLTGQIMEAPLPVDRTVAQQRAGGPATFSPEQEVAACQAYCDAVRVQAAAEPQTRTLRRQVLAQSRHRRLTDKRVNVLLEDRRKRWVQKQLTLEGTRRAQAYGWNDVYTFTKAMGEQLLTLRRGEVPLVIVRPSIVESSLEDPEPGWMFGLKVADPLIVGYARGVVPDFPTARDVVMDLIPVDIVVNTIIAAGTCAIAGQVRVFHATTSGVRPLSIEELYRHVREYFLLHPLRGRNGDIPRLPEWRFPSHACFMYRFRWQYLYPVRLKLWLLDRMPERLAPTTRRRRLAALEKRLLRVLYYSELFGPYTRLNCRYRLDATQALYESLPASEQRCFSMDVERIDWGRYFREIHIPGLRRYVLGEQQTEEALLHAVPTEARNGEDL
jgi:nucleoside-diphosphate-sugar epimerase